MRGRAVAALAIAVAVVLSTATAAGAGTRWHVEPTQNPATLDSTLRGVSCVDPTFCVAVGYEDPSSTEAGTLIEQWNGTSWSLMDDVDPTSVSLLYGVSCLTTTSCTAVGQAVGSGTLVEVWDGAAWTRVGSPNAGSPNFANLQSVSCVSASMCMAVGGKPDAALTEIWDGSAWKIVPSAPGLDVLSLEGVSCVNDHHCVAVGVESRHGTTTELWNGRRWKLMTGATPNLWSVSCVNVGHCVAVGNQTIATWDGTAWTTQPGPTQGDAAVLYGVSCVSLTRCIAAGDWGVNHAHANRVHPLVDAWDGTSWTVTKTPNPPNGPHHDVWLGSVSCSTHHACAVVGWQNTPPGRQTLALVSG